MRNRFTAYAEKDSLIRLGESDSAALPNEFEILVWNMAKCRHRGWEEDFLRLIHQRHLLVLQEAALSAVNLEIFDQSESFEWLMARSFRWHKSGTDKGVKTGSRCAANQSSAYRAPDLEPLLGTPKMALASVYPIGDNGENLLLLNAHAINFSPLHMFRRQLQQILESIAEHRGPLVLAGDFNAWSSNRYHHLRWLSRDLGLAEVDLQRNRRARHLGRHLDHLFYRGLQLIESHVHEEISSSDHYPISALFRLESAS